jgi:uncharacterized membrane protein YedE/YeeE
MQNTGSSIQFWIYRKPLLLSAGFLLSVLVITFGLQANLKLVGLFILGILLGITLLKSAFGFSAAYRRAFLYRDLRAVKAQLLMLLLGTFLVVPVLANGSIFGHGVSGAFAPLGLQVVAGAFLFGLGMQLGGGCGSGTLFTLGGGSPRMLITLIAFIAGSFWASLHMYWWWQLPSLPTISLGKSIGWGNAFIAQTLVLFVLFILMTKWHKPQPGQTLPENNTGWLQGLLLNPWNIYVGAMLLALLNWLTLLIAGHPWSITWGFTLWGAKTASLLGWDPAGSSFWSGGFQQSALNGPLLHDTTSLMNIGIILGAFLAAVLSNRFAPRFSIAPASFAAAVAGGLAMGYGARIGFGCNIGAFFSGVISTSMHGWLWILAALVGTWSGIKLRPVFKLDN